MTTRLVLPWILPVDEEDVMKEATYDDAVQIARVLNMNIDSVWRVTKGTVFRQYCDLRIAVLNSPGTACS